MNSHGPPRESQCRMIVCHEAQLQQESRAYKQRCLISNPRHGRAAERQVFSNFLETVFCSQDDYLLPVCVEKASQALTGNETFVLWESVHLQVHRWMLELQCTMESATGHTKNVLTLSWFGSTRRWILNRRENIVIHCMFKMIVSFDVWWRVISIKQHFSESK